MFLVVHKINFYYLLGLDSFLPIQRQLSQSPSQQLPSAVSERGLLQQYCILTLKKNNLIKGFDGRKSKRFPIYRYWIFSDQIATQYREGKEWQQPAAPICPSQQPPSPSHLKLTVKLTGESRTKKLYCNSRSPIIKSINASDF